MQEADFVIHLLQEKGKLKKRTLDSGDFNSFSSHDSVFYAGTGVRDSMYRAQKQNKALRN